MDSDYCYSVEMQRALERHKRGEVRVIPVIVRPVHWQSELGKLQVLPRDAVPVTDSKWHTLDEAFFEVAKGIKTTIEKLPARTVKQMPPAGNAQDEVRRNDEQSKTSNANLARPPSPISQQWFRGKWIRNVLVPVTLLIAVIT